LHDFESIQHEEIPSAPSIAPMICARKLEDGTARGSNAPAAEVFQRGFEEFVNERFS